MKPIFFLTIGILLTACTATEPDDEYQRAYEDMQHCNGDMKISHALVIGDTKDGNSSQSKTTAVCNPSMYPSETDFEKENRRVKN